MGTYIPIIYTKTALNEKSCNEAFVIYQPTVYQEFLNKFKGTDCNNQEKNSKKENLKVLELFGGIRCMYTST